MKLIKLLVLFQLIVFFGYGQDKPLSSSVKSKFVNEEDIFQFVQFDEKSSLQVENGPDFLKEFLETSEKTSFVLTKSQTDKLGFLHETYQQYYNNIPIEFGIYKIHFNNEKVSAINGEYYRTTELNTTPTITAKRAVSIAQQNAANVNYNELDYEESNPTLMIFPKLENINRVNRLAYKLTVNAEKPRYCADVYVDAHTGEIIFENNKIHKIDVPAQGATLYNGTKSFLAEQIGNNYRLRQSTYGNGIETYIATNGVSNATDIISSDTNFTSADSAAVQVHWGTERTYQYYLQNHSRNSFDDNGALIKSYITPPSAVPSAFYHVDGGFFGYSTGYGSTFSPLTSLDIVGHEITHAVVDHSADLIFAYQSGAINESYADIFGEMVENFGQGSNDWLCGASCVQNGIRSMSDPKSKGQPDTYLGQYWHTDSTDNFGVHTNSGVHNKWFYLLAVGGTGTNDHGYTYSVNGIGMDAAAKIAYRTLNLYLTPTSKFHYTCEVSLYATIQLFGPNSPEHIAAAEAWKAVGVLQQPTEWIAPSTPLNLAITSATPYIVDLSWNASTDNVGVLGYAILKDGNKVGVTGNTSKTVSGFYLEPNITYEFTVRAFDAAGNYSAESNTVPIVFDNINPSSPTNLTSFNTTQTTTELFWTGSTDNVGVVGYIIYQSGSSIDTVYGVTTCTVNNLTPSTNYGFYVRAIDAAGNKSGPSNSVNVTTLMTCTGGNGSITLTISFNDFPTNYWTNPGNPTYTVSWNILDATNTVVASGSNYPGFLYGTSLAQPITLGPGLYTFDIIDNLGWGNGFVLESNQVIASQTNLSLFLPMSFCVDNTPSFTPTNSISNATQNNVKSSGMIYPNPVLDRLFFKNIDSENKTFSIVDVTGKIFLAGVLDSKNSLDVSKLQTGIYIIKISGNEETLNYKFIKK